jgi:hypothetical protein
VKEPHVWYRSLDIVQERCLADPGFAMNKQCATLAGAKRGDYVFE